MKWNILLITLGLSLFACSPDSDSPKDTDTKTCDNPLSLSNSSDDADLMCLIPQKEHKALALYFMSTDCPGCGSWGTNMFHELLAENEAKVEPMQVHIKYSDPFIVPGFSDSLAAHYSPNYTPFNMIQNYSVTNRFQVNYDFEDAKAKAKVKVDEIISEPAEVAPALNYKFHYDKIEIHYGAEFLKASNESYYFGIYVVENNLEWPQAGQSKSPYFHDNTIRTVAEGAFGVSLNENPVKVGDVKTGKVFTPLYGFWKKEDIYLLGVIWKRGSNGKMEIVNAMTFKK